MGCPRPTFSFPKLMDPFKTWDHTSGLPSLKTNTTPSSIEPPPTPCSEWECSSPATNPSLHTSPAPSLTAPTSVGPGFAFCTGGLSPSSPLPFGSAPSLLLDQAFEMAGPYNFSNNHDPSGQVSFSFVPKEEYVGEQQQHQQQYQQQRQLPELLPPVTYIPHQLHNMEFQLPQFDLGINTNTTGLIPYTVSHTPMYQLSPFPLAPQFQQNCLFTPRLAPVPSHGSGHPGTPHLVNYVDSMFSFTSDLALHNRQPTPFSMSLPEPLPLTLHTSTAHLQLPGVPSISTSTALSSSSFLPPHINFDYITSTSPSTSMHLNTVLPSRPQIIVEPPSTMATPLLKHERPPSSPFSIAPATETAAPTPSPQPLSVSPALNTVEKTDPPYDHLDHDHEPCSPSPTPPPAPPRRRRASTKQSATAASTSSSSAAAASSTPRMYTCPYVARGKCTRQPFSRLYNLRVHMDVHRPERKRRFACDTCTRSYFRVNELRRHVRKSGHDATAAFVEQDDEDEEVDEEEDGVKFEEDEEDDEEDFEEEVVVRAKGKSRTGRSRRSKDGDGSASPTCWP